MSFIGKVTNFLPFGAVKINPFPKAVPCTTNQIFCQPTEQFDDIAFQFEVSESTELITNGSFTASTAGWTYGGWQLAVVANNWFMGQVATVNSLSQLGILSLFDVYRVTLTISNNQGVVSFGGGLGATISSLALSTTSNGTFTVYFVNETFGHNDFIIHGDSDSLGVTIDEVSVVKISDTSDYDIEIINQETGAVIDSVNAINISLTKNIITVDFNWTDDLTVTNGCRQIQVIDNTNLFEDNFANNQGWTLETDIVIAAGLMTYISTGADRTAFINGIFVVGESYEITFTTSGIGVPVTAQVSCGRTLGTVRTTNATFVEVLTCTDTTRLSFTFTGAGAATVSIDNIFIKKENNIAGRSECYDLQDSHDCTLLFEWSNDNKWGFFDYDATTGDADVGIRPFVHRLRIEAKFRGTKYPSVRNIGENSAGLKAMDYTSFRKQKTLDIHRAPDYIHDGIAAMFMQDTRTIEGISYILVDEYEPSSPNDSRVLWKDLMTSRTELEETDQPNQINRT